MGSIGLTFAVHSVERDHQQRELDVHLKAARWVDSNVLGVDGLAAAIHEGADVVLLRADDPRLLGSAKAVQVD